MFHGSEVYMLYFIGDSLSMHTLPVCHQKSDGCVYSEQVYTGISYSLIDLCVYIHRSLDINPHYTDSNKDISKFSSKGTMYFYIYVQASHK